MLLLASLGINGTVWAQAPRPGARLSEHLERLPIGPRDRCPVCAMRPQKYPRFAAALQLADGTTYYFCSAGCMLKAWLRPDVFLDTSPDALHRPVVLDYFSGRPVDARQVVWISGSDVVGPMGPALVPVADPAHTDVFRRRHGGTRVFRLDDLDEDNWKALTGKPFQF
jgi:nitrous oxide reductase accessory protein NosL